MLKILLIAHWHGVWMNCLEYLRLWSFYNWMCQTNLGLSPTTDSRTTAEVGKCKWEENALHKPQTWESTEFNPRLIWATPTERDHWPLSIGVNPSLMSEACTLQRDHTWNHQSPLPVSIITKVNQMTLKLISGTWMLGVTLDSRSRSLSWVCSPCCQHLGRPPREISLRWSWITICVT